MATVHDFPSSTGEVPCTYHPNVQTRLRCSRCGKPICPRCGVRTPVGLRCPECAGVRGLPTYRTESTTLLKAGGIGLAVAIAVGALWAYAPDWGFYLSLLLGFGVAEAMAWASKAKRGLDLQLLGMAIVAVGLVVSRVLLAQRLGIPWEFVSEMVPGVERALHIQFSPDGIFAALSFAIIWIRFR
ncbi:MAG: B-box zinc finger protein [Thermomicrobiales bacterium]